MNLRTTAKLMEKYETCPNCGSDKIGNGAGALIVDDVTFVRSCKCGWRVKVDANDHVASATKREPDFLPPQKGGCWYCNRLEPKSDLQFDGEFDTNVHTRCIREMLEREPEHPEATLQKYLLEGDDGGA